MNAAFNHGSQGDFFSSLGIGGKKDSANKLSSLSKAPVGTGELIRNAARDNQLEVLRELLNKFSGDPVVNEGDDIGTTALHTAASNGHKECVELLLQFGANVELKNCYGQTAYAKTSNSEIQELIKPKEVEFQFCSVM